MLWSARLPVSDFILAAIGLLIGIVSGLLSVISSAGELTVLKHVPRSRRRKMLLLATPFILAMTWVLVVSGVPSSLMFRANKPAMDVWVKKFLTTSTVPPGGFANIGSYGAYNIKAIPGGVKFLVNGAGFFRSGGGFAYSPDGPPAPTPFETFTPIRSGWYVETYDEP
jgi:hypothetical protein